MVLKEFLADLNTVTDFLVETGFVDLVNEFATTAQSAKSGAVSDWRTLLEDQLIKLDQVRLDFEVQNSVLLVENSYLKLTEIGEFLFDYRNVITDLFEDILQADILVANLVERLRTFKSHSEQIRAALNVVGVEMPKPEKREANLVIFEFKHKSDVATLKELSATARLLNVHLRSISKLDLTTPTTDIEISVISKSSPLDIQAWVSEKVASALNKIVAGILDNLKKIQELRILEETVKQQKLDTKSKKLELALQARRAELEVAVIDKISKQLVRQFPDDSPNGTKNEVETGVKKAVEYFIKQTNKGLEIKVLPSTSEIQSESNGNIIVQSYQDRVAFAEEILHSLPNGQQQESEEESTEE